MHGQQNIKFDVCDLHLNILHVKVSYASINNGKYVQLISVQYDDPLLFTGFERADCCCALTKQHVHVI
jgi:hypothetical protein